ncbi:MAG: hypothetical protein E7Z94_11235, partial [Actinomyces ruminicola]|nr:hypothetical protein [Actinomyces ruminicola]
MRSRRCLTTLIALVAAVATVFAAPVPPWPHAQAAPTEACTASDNCSFYLSNSFRGGAADAA